MLSFQIQCRFLGLRRLVFTALLLLNSLLFAQPHLCLMAMNQAPFSKDAANSKDTTKRWLNVSTILHLEANDQMLKIYTSLGGLSNNKPTYEITVRSVDEAYLWVSKIQTQARTCQLEMFALPPLPSNTPVPKFLPKEPPFK